MTRNITKLKKAIAEKEGYMALAHTRLGNRAQRPGIELCRDLVETNLVNEVRELRENVAKLQQMLAEVSSRIRRVLLQNFLLFVGRSITSLSPENTSAIGRGYQCENKHTEN